MPHHRLLQGGVILPTRKQNFPMEEDAYWLKDWALFCAIKEDQGGKPWYEWPEPLKNRNPEALAEFDNLLEPYILEQQAFTAEWSRLENIRKQQRHQNDW